MKTVVFKAHMLLGDAIYCAATIGRYMREHPEDRVIIECLDEYPKEIYQWIPGNPEITFATDTPCDVRYEFDVSAAMHHAVAKKQPIWISLGELLGLPADSRPGLNIPLLEIAEEWKDAYVICPFSRSCTSHQKDAEGKPLPANKTLPLQTWLPLIRHLRRHGKVLFVSALDERFEHFALNESERVAGYRLALVASVFAAARCVISVDNGLARISALTSKNTAILMPEFLPLEVFAPAVWSLGHTRIIQVDVRMDANAFVASMKNFLRVHAKAF